MVHSWQLDRKVSETDPAGRVTSFTYDARGRLTLQKATTSGLGTDAMESQRLYDVTGRLAKAVDLTEGHSLTTPGVAGRYLYDKLGRLTTEVGYASNNDSTGLTHFHHYDRAGNRVRSELACGMGVAKRLLTTTLDTHHRPVILHDDNQTPGVTTDDRLTRWLYDPAGRTVRVILANGQIQVNHHDAAGRLVLRALHRKPAAGQTISNATLLASFTWNHDAAGNVKSQTENWHASGSQSARSRATAMAYDASNRLAEERIHDSGGTDPVVTTYTYDAANNRTGKTVVTEGLNALPGQEFGHWSYTYNTANQLTRWEKRAAPGTGAILSAASYSYDKNGNRLSKVVDGTTSLAVRTTTYTWDSWNRLAEVIVPVTSTSKKLYEYTYDYRMRRKSLRQSGGGLKTHHTAVVFNGGLSVAEFRRSSNAALSPTDLPWARYLRGPDMGGGVGGLLGTLRHPVNSYERPVSPTASNPVTERVNLSNGRGDIVAQSDVAGTLTWTASYEAYGKRTLELGSNEDRQRANTKEEDPTGLLNEGYRYRDLETGVWLSRDPAGFVDGPNLYAYVKQNPWTGWDPHGLKVEVKRTKKEGPKPPERMTSAQRSAWNRDQKNADHGSHTEITIRAALLDETSAGHTPEQLEAMRQSIVNSVNNAYTGKSGKNSWSMKLDLRIVKSAKDIQDDDHELILKDFVQSKSFAGYEFGGYALKSDRAIESGSLGIGGNTMVISMHSVNKKGVNLGSLSAHEFGHTMGLRHPEDLGNKFSRSTFKSDNLMWHKVPSSPAPVDQRQIDSIYSDYSGEKLNQGRSSISESDFYFSEEQYRRDNPQ